MLKCNRKNEIDAFLNDCDEIMMEKSHCNDDGKVDGSMKAHYCRFFM